MLKKLLSHSKVSYLFGVVGIALFTLFIFQLIWLNNSRNLIQEQFDQKVNLAMGSALSDFNTNHKTELDVDDMQQCGTGDDYKYLPLEDGFMSTSDQVELKEYLNTYMTYFGINEKYSVDIFDSSCSVREDAYCCSIVAPANCDLEYHLGVSFLSRNKYLFDRMKFMIISSILIFLLLSAVSFLILRALIRQKKVTENNIDFFNNTAHELKTPLTNITLALNLLRKKHPNIAEEKYAHIIKDESKKLSSQVERVLFLSRMENGEHKLKKEAINIRSILLEVVDNMHLMIEEKNGDVELAVTDQDIVILGDYYHISNVFRNLLDNALKYSGQSPHINISLEEDDDYVKVIFKDNGVGISKSDQEHIFEKFQRVNTGDVREAKGFGIGLSYVKTVIELHKGLIKVQSELNKGSQFELLLPNV